MNWKKKRESVIEDGKEGGDKKKRKYEVVNIEKKENNDRFYTLHTTWRGRCIF